MGFLSSQTLFKKGLIYRVIVENNKCIFKIISVIDCLQDSVFYLFADTL